MSATVVVAHYNEDINWTNVIDRNRFNVQIYSKSLREYNFQVVNRGNEASAYLQYIIDNYNNLSEHNFFVHGHDNSYHQDITNTEFFKSIKLPPVYSFFNFNKRDYYIKSLKNDHNVQYNILKQHWPFEELKVPDDLSFYSCAQFYINKNSILRHPKSLYEKMIDWLYCTEIDNQLHVPQNYYSARLFEYMWCLIFTGNEHEQILSYKELFN
jgi:hypothetical protein